ncbi:MAG: chromate transporter [Clostridiales bacterium]|nr:chromate transporter [Clostridiales bacterium]
MKKLWELFTTFFRIGAFTFGGGYAMLALLQKEIVEIHKWASEEELLDYYAIAQCTPGVIAVNTATFIGVKQKGIIGGIVATLGLVLPSIVIIAVIAAFLKNFMEYKIVGHILGGIKAVVAALILDAVVTIGKKAIVDKVCIAIAILSFIASVFFSVSPVFIVIAACAVGIILKGRKRGGENNA